MYANRIIQLTVAFVLAVTLHSSSGDAAASGSLAGTWRTEGGRSHVRFSRCGGGWCGRVVWLRISTDSSGKPLKDENNPDPGLRNRNLLGLRIFYNLTAKGGEGVWQGHVYNPQDGDVYNAFLTVESERRLRVKGCIGEILCGTQTWSRVSRSSTPESTGNTQSADTVR